MAKILLEALLVVITALCIYQVMATADADEIEALVAIRARVPELWYYYWSDAVLSEVCKSVDSPTDFVACEDGHVSGLYATRIFSLVSCFCCCQLIFKQADQDNFER